MRCALSGYLQVRVRHVHDPPRLAADLRTDCGDHATDAAARRSATSAACASCSIMSCSCSTDVDPHNMDSEPEPQLEEVEEAEPEKVSIGPKMASGGWGIPPRILVENAGSKQVNHMFIRDKEDFKGRPKWSAYNLPEGHKNHKASKRTLYRSDGKWYIVRDFTCCGLTDLVTAGKRHASGSAYTDQRYVSVDANLDLPPTEPAQWRVDVKGEPPCPTLTFYGPCCECGTQYFEDANDCCSSIPLPVERIPTRQCSESEDTVGYATRVRRHDELSALLQRAVARMRQRELSCAFCAWFDHATRMSRSRALLQRAVARMRRRELSCAFCAWFDYATRMSRSRALLQRAVARMRQRELSQAFYEWVQYEWTRGSQPTSELAEHNRLTRRFRAQVLASFVSLVLLVLSFSFGFEMMSASLETSTRENVTSTDTGRPLLSIGQPVPADDFMLWVAFASGDLALRCIASLSVLALWMPMCCNVFMGLIQKCSELEQACTQAIDNSKGHGAKRTWEDEWKRLPLAKYRHLQTQMFETDLLDQAVVDALAKDRQNRHFPKITLYGPTIFSCIVSQLPMRSADVQLGPGAETTLWFLAIVFAMLLFWLGQLVHQFDYSCWHPYQVVHESRTPSQTSKQSDLKIGPASLAGSAASESATGSDLEGQPSLAVTAASEPESESCAYNGGPAGCCRQYRLHAYPNDDSDAEVVWDPVLIRRKIDRVKHRLHTLGKTDGDRKKLYDTRERIRGIRGWLRHWGAKIVPKVTMFVLLSACAQVITGTTLLGLTCGLVLLDKQWVFSRHLSAPPASFRVALVSAILLGFMASCMHCTAAFTSNGGNRMLEGSHTVQIGDRAILAGAKATTKLRNACKSVRTALVPLQFFGAMLVTAVKLMYWVCKDNFHGELSSDLVENSALLILVIWIWWTLCCLLHSNIATTETHQVRGNIRP